jgi:hypothetical protein
VFFLIKKPMMIGWTVPAWNETLTFRIFKNNSINSFLVQEYLPMVSCVEFEEQMFVALPHKLEHEPEPFHCR